MSMWYRWWKAVEVTGPGSFALLGVLFALAAPVLLVTGKQAASAWLTASDWVFLAFAAVTIVRVIAAYRRGLSGPSFNASRRGQ